MRRFCLQFSIISGLREINEGASRYSASEQFIELGPLHIGMHKLGQQIADLCMEGKKYQIKDKVKKLIQLKENTLGKLPELQINVAESHVQ